MLEQLDRPGQRGLARGRRVDLCSEPLELRVVVEGVELDLPVLAPGIVVGCLSGAEHVGEQLEVGGRERGTQRGVETRALRLEHDGLDLIAQSPLAIGLVHEGLLELTATSAPRDRVTVEHGREDSGASPQAGIAHCMLEPLSRTFPPLAPLPTTTSAVAERIREAILGGMLEPGERLKEEQLARELGTSRTPVREALLRLQSEGLVDAAPNRGATVRLYGRAELEEMYDLRALLEGHAARRAAERIDEEALAELRASCERFSMLVGGSDLHELVAENATFHRAVWRAAASERLASMIEEVVAIPLVYRSYVWYSPEQSRSSHDLHRRVLAALAARDGVAAETLMHQHVLAGRDVLLAALDREEELR